MDDLKKNAETEKPIVEQNDSKKEATGSSMVNTPKVPAKRIRVRAKTKPTPSILTQSAPMAAVEITAKKIDEPKSKEKVSKKGGKTEAEIVVVKSPKKEKTETKPIVTKVVAVDLQEEMEKPDSVKVIKKKAKKAEEKVVKLKKKVKKAKKKDVKKSKLKDLKGKLEKALDKFKENSKKLKEVKEE